MQSKECVGNDLSRSTIDTFTPNSWKTGQSSMDAKKANESPQSNFASMNSEELNSEVQPRRILKAQRASLAQTGKVYQLSSFGKQPQAPDASN